MPQQIEVFFSYAHEDEDLMNHVRRQLVVLERAGRIQKWHDRQIPPGADWQSDIDQRLRSSRIVLLLVSPHFLDSQYCYEVEGREALRRHESGDACVIPVILRPCLWQEAPFAKLQALPRDGVPIASWPNIDEACLNVAQGILAVVEQLEHNGQDQRDALPVLAVTTTPQLGELSLVDRPVNLSPKEHEHHLKVVFTYRGSASIRDWYTELEFPTRLLRRNHQYDSEVPERSNSSVSFFRWTNQPHGERIFPGDPKTMVRFIYAYEPTLIKDPTPVLDARICARVFVDSRLVAEKMITVRELRAQAANRRDPQGSLG